MSKRYRRLFYFGLLIVLIIWLRSSEWSLNFRDLDLFINYLSGIVSDQPVMTAIIYILVSGVSSVLLALPGISFAIIASALFPPLLATILCAIAASLGAGLSFWVGRYFLKGSLGDFAKRSQLLNRFLFEGTIKHPMRLLMITRLVPLFPFNLQNFAYGMTDMSFTTYLWGTFIFIIPGTAMYTFGTSGLINLFQNGFSGGAMGLLYIAFAVILGFVVVRLSKKIQKTYVGEGENESESESKSESNNNLKSDQISTLNVVTKLDKVRYMESSLDTTLCTSCGACQSQCKFLSKYEMDFSNLEALENHAFECFLCGACSRVCPENIDGRQMFLDLRRQKRLEAPLKLWPYLSVILEKRRYIFANRVKKGKRTLIYWGCNFPALYPQTTDEAMSLLSDDETTSIFDCCGKPLQELGMYEEASARVKRLNDKLDTLGIEEVVLVCPNCYQFLQGKLSSNVRMTRIYDTLRHRNLGKPIKGEPIDLFPPCPDRQDGLWLQSISPFLPESSTCVQEPQCCGAGGCASVQSPDLSGDFRKGLLTERPYAYCATCAGQFKRGGQAHIKHVLSEILGIQESPRIKTRNLHRLKFKFK